MSKIDWNLFSMDVLLITVPEWIIFKSEFLKFMLTLKRFLERSEPNADMRLVYILKYINLSVILLSRLVLSA